MTVYFRALAQSSPRRPRGAVPIAGGPAWFTHAEVLSRDDVPEIVPAAEIPPHWLEQITAPRPDLAGLDLSRPRVMGILNVTPDSFSDGGDHANMSAATTAAANMLDAGADILDIGGESTRPGAAEVDVEEEILRTAPVIAALRAQKINDPLSIDTRKAKVAAAALAAGATLVNDVSGFSFDPDLAPVCAKAQAPVCIMHSQGLPETMQVDPRYDHVLLDVYDHLAHRIAALDAQGIPRARMMVDPGIGFGKTLAHNLALLQNISLFHGLGVPILLGASRKGFIGKLGNAPDPKARAPGSIAVALAACAQGVQLVRVHDVADTRQALTLWRAVQMGSDPHGR